MPDFKTILKNFGSAVCQDQRFAKLLRDLETHSFDGTETHRAIDHALPGIENADATATIKAADKAIYANSISIDVAFELFLAFRESEERAGHSRQT
jgi:hypothetical protein